MPKAGDNLVLSLLLEDGATDKFPRCYLYDAAGSALAGSPVDLAHVANGLYRNTTLFMPNTLAVSALFKVFSDAGHTALDTAYSQELDTFLLEEAPILATEIGMAIEEAEGASIAMEIAPELELEMSIEEAS